MNSIGEMVRIKTEQESIEGKLTEASEEGIVVQSGDETHSIIYSEILKGRTFVAW